MGASTASLNDECRTARSNINPLLNFLESGNPEAQEQECRMSHSLDFRRQLTHCPDIEASTTFQGLKGIRLPARIAVCSITYKKPFGLEHLDSPNERKFGAFSRAVATSWITPSAEESSSWR